ncbi:MAG TPA: indole-3-glycerol phosphate synthase TrpC [Methylomirabilota bacterium]|jgi:indole-3-glycerol phosphate synthase|nr:indole-3-glycerol phosphate synthase TrpC [Methylomirabilota bacterium]
MASPAGILAKIVAAKRVAVAARQAGAPRPVLEARAASLAPARDVAAALTPRPPGRVRLLAELKRASPVAGLLARDFDPVPLAPAYVAAGAAALSVLTDPHFQGSLADLDAVRALVDCPLLEKDFVVDDYQLWEARAHGADAVLLIVAILEPARLVDLYQTAKGLGLSILVEVHDEAELDAAAELGAGLIGINNRDLETFRTDLATTERLAPRAPAGVRLVSESGIATPADVARVAAAGAHAILVGEALSRSGDPAAKVRELTGGPA